MANEHRQPRDYFFGTLSLAAALSDVTLTSAAFAALPTVYSATTYLPLVLHDPSSGLYEVVWVTGHASLSMNVTVARGKEGTAARQWPTGTQVVCAPTLRDSLYPVATRSALPSDAHIGMRAEIADEGVIAEKLASGWVTPGGWTSYTPTWVTSGTNPSLGNGVLTGEYTRIGNLVIARVGLTWGSTTTGGGAGLGWSFSTPIQAAYSSGHNPWPLWLGSGLMRDLSATAYFIGNAFVDAAGTGMGLIASAGQVASNVPFAWASGDHLSIQVAYRAA